MLRQLSDSSRYSMEGAWERPESMERAHHQCVAARGGILEGRHEKRGRGASAKVDPRHNQLLAALPAADYEHLVPYLELVSLPVGRVVHECGSRLDSLYFVTAGIISQSCLMKDGFNAEIAAVGNEGAIDVSLFMGTKTSLSRAVVQSAGHAYRLRADRLEKEFRYGGSLQNLLLRYTHALIAQMAQTAVCNRHHTVEQQVCKWLLRSLDRLPTNDMAMTQELIGGMLGVRREAVTEAAGKLQAAGLIQYRRGHITVVDRPKLESHACECYAAVKQEFSRLLPQKTLV